MAPALLNSRIGIVVGHTWRSPGAYSGDMHMHEYEFNADLAWKIARLSRDVGVFWRDGHGVAGAYKNLHAWGAKVAIELHFNSHARTATGTETLCTTDRSLPLAKAVHKRMVECLEIADRGVRLPWEGRGAASLNAVPIPSIIIEPFFGSNQADCARVCDKKDDLARAILNGAREALGLWDI